MDDRFVLCMPAGGLNDVLCQLQKCWRYSENHGRRLVINTTKTGLLDSFHNYFSIANCSANVLTSLCAATQESLATLTCKPSGLQGPLMTLTPVYSEAELNFVDGYSGEVLIFYFERDWSEKLLVHCLRWRPSRD
jgi:hypothetical protein